MGKKRVAMFLDTRVIEYYKRLASDPNSAGYQTRINNDLVRLVERREREKATQFGKPTRTVIKKNVRGKR
jgi:hypothetical protein